MVVYSLRIEEAKAWKDIFSLRRGGLAANMESFTKLLDAIVPLLQTIIWPLLVLFILLYLGRSLKDFLKDLGELNFKAGVSGFEASAKTKEKIEAAVSLGAAIGSKKDDHQQANIQEIANLISQATTPAVTRRLSEASVLWVDDFPDHQIYERNALSVLGIHFALSPSTEDALRKLQMKKYDAIISDMSRPPDIKAGYTLLAEMPEKNKKTPFIIYSSAGSVPQHQVEAYKNGAFGSTNKIQELFELIINAITGNSGRSDK